MRAATDMSNSVKATSMLLLACFASLIEHVYTGK